MYKMLQKMDLVENDAIVDCSRIITICVNIKREQNIKRNIAINDPYRDNM